LPSCENFTPLEYDPIIAEPQALSLIWDTDNIIKIGEIFRKKFPEDMSERKLVKLILSNMTLDKNAPVKSLQEKIEQDYTSGTIVMIDGWLLSVTEARQCALFSLISPK
jgi:hypothetical protein